MLIITTAEIVAAKHGPEEIIFRQIGDARENRVTRHMGMSISGGFVCVVWVTGSGFQDQAW